METIQKAKFSLGRIVATPGALDALQTAEDEAFVYLYRHACGDWGEVCPDDQNENEESLTHGFRLLSVYRLKSREKIWIITEADRSVTTILLPHEY